VIQFLFDTNICVALIRVRRAAPILARMALYPDDSFALSAITLAELQFGVANSRDPLGNATLLLRFLAGYGVLPFDDRAAAAYGPVRAFLEGAGASIGALDTLIAAHALSSKITLVTNNEREFRRVPGLTVENWTLP